MSASYYQFNYQEDNLFITLSVAKFDATVTEEFLETLDGNWKKGTSGVIIDTKSIDFIDSSGVGALLAIRKKLPPEAPAITLIGPQPSVIGVLEMLRLHRIFQIEPA